MRPRDTIKRNKKRLPFDCRIYVTRIPKSNRGKRKTFFTRSRHISPPPLMKRLWFIFYFNFRLFDRRFCTQPVTFQKRYGNDEKNIKAKYKIIVFLYRVHCRDTMIAMLLSLFSFDVCILFFFLTIVLHINNDDYAFSASSRRNWAYNFNRTQPTPIKCSQPFL